MMKNGSESLTESPRAENIVSYWDPSGSVIDPASATTKRSLAESIALIIPDTSPEPGRSEAASATMKRPRSSRSESNESVFSRNGAQQHKSEAAPAPMKRSRSKSNESVLSNADPESHKTEAAPAPMKRSRSKSSESVLSNAEPESHKTEAAPAPMKRSRSKSIESVLSDAIPESHKTEAAPAPMKRSRSKSNDSVLSVAAHEANENPTEISTPETPTLLVTPAPNESEEIPLKRSRARSSESRSSEATLNLAPPPKISKAHVGESVSSEVDVVLSTSEITPAIARQSRAQSSQSITIEDTPVLRKLRPSTLRARQMRARNNRAVAADATLVPRKPASTPAVTKQSRAKSSRAVASDATPALSKPASTPVVTKQSRAKSSRAVASDATPALSKPASTPATTRQTRAQRSRAVASDATPALSTPASTPATTRQSRAKSSRVVELDGTPVLSKPKSAPITRQTRAQSSRAVASDAPPVLSTPASTPATTGQPRAESSRVVELDGTPVPSTLASTPTTTGQSRAESSQVVELEGTPVLSTLTSTPATTGQSRAESSRAVPYDAPPVSSTPASTPPTTGQSRAESNRAVTPDVVSATTKRPKAGATSAPNKKSKSTEPPIVLDVDAPLPTQASDGSPNPAFSGNSFVCIKGVVYKGATLLFETDKLVCKLPDGSDYSEETKKVIGMFRVRECDRCYWIKLPNTRKGGNENKAILFYSLKKKHPEVVQDVMKTIFKPAVMSHSKFLSLKPIEELTRGWDSLLWNNAWSRMVSIIKNKPFVETPASSSSAPIPARTSILPRDGQRSMPPRLLSADRPRRLESGFVSKSSFSGRSLTPPESVASSRQEATLSQEAVLPENEFLQLDNAQLFQADISRLRSGEFLNDACINFFVKFLQVFLVPKFDHVKKKLFAFSTHFFSRLIAFDAINGEAGHANVPRWTKALQKEVGSAGLFTQDLIAIPINQNNIHWWLALIMLPASGDTKVAIDPSQMPELDSRPVRTSTPKATAETTSQDCAANGSSDSQKADAVGEKTEPKEAVASAPTSENLEKGGTVEGAENAKQGETNAEKAECDDKVDGDTVCSSALAGTVASEDAATAVSSAHTGAMATGETDPGSSVALSDAVVADGDTDRVLSSRGQTVTSKATDDQVKVVDSQRKEEEEERPDLSNHPGPIVLLLDSAAEQPAEENVYAAEYIKGYLRREWFICGQMTDFDTSKIAVQKVKTPKQRNGVDCGVFVLEYLIRFIHDPKLLGKVLTSVATPKVFEFAQERCTKRRNQLRLCAHKMVLEANKTKRSDVREMISHNPALLHELCGLLFAEKPARRESLAASTPATDRAHRLPTPLAQTRLERPRTSANPSNTATTPANTRIFKSVAKSEGTPKTAITASKCVEADPGEFYAIRDGHGNTQKAVASPPSVEAYASDASMETVEASPVHSPSAEGTTEADEVPLNADSNESCPIMLATQPLK